EERTSLEFFKVLNFVLRFCPTHPSEKGLMARFANIGIGPGQNFDPDSLSPEVRRAIKDGIADAWLAHADVATRIAAGKLTACHLFGTREHLKNNYLFRMAAAAAGIYGNSNEEAFYWIYYVDSAGRKLDTTDDRYLLRLTPGQLPPVNAFWSL